MYQITLLCEYSCVMLLLYINYYFEYLSSFTLACQNRVCGSPQTLLLSPPIKDTDCHDIANRAEKAFKTNNQSNNPYFLI